MKQSTASKLDEAQPSSDHVSIDTMSIDELRARVKRAISLVAQIAALFPGLVLLDEQSRSSTTGRVRSDDELKALGAVLDAVDLSPAHFACLADNDDGRDPKVLETGLLRERLERQGVLAEVIASVAPLAQKLADTALVQGELSKPVILAAYTIAKPIAARDKVVGSALTPAVDYYGRIARKAARTRAARKSK